MARPLLLHSIGLGCVLLTTAASGAENLVVDASFESPLPAWFAQHPGTSYYAGKEHVSDAADGSTVLAIEAWDRQGSRVMSGPIRWHAAEAAHVGLSATVTVRSRETAAGVTLELALFDERGAKRLVSFGQLTLDGQGHWQTLSQAGVKPPPGEEAGRLVFLIKGPSENGRVEVDRVGLFEGPKVEVVGDNSDLAVVEAEEMADGVVWKVVEHYGGWYQGFPSGMKMLAGPHAVKPEENRPVVRSLTVRRPGAHTLWIRYQAGPIVGKFTVTLRQHGTVVAQKEIAEDAMKGNHGYAWVWDSIAGDLRPGEAEIVLTRPAKGASWVTRKIDLFVLTNRPDYVPQVEHFQPRTWLRFTNLSSQPEPLCLWIYVRRHQGPHWYANPGILSRAGLSQGYGVPADRSKWLATGQHSPWVPISEYLLAAGGRNNVQLVATRKSHTDGFVQGRLQGRLELAGEDRRAIKTIDVDQNGPRILMTLPADPLTQPQEIKTALDYILETEAQVAALGPAPGRPAQAMNMAANLSLRDGVDDREVVRREIAILRGLGFNQTYQMIAPPETAVAFCRQQGLLPRLGGGPHLWGAILDKSQHHPDLAAMETLTRRFAEEHRSILPYFVRFKLMDEPGGMSYDDLAKSEPCRRKFVDWLKAQGLSPQQLGVDTWDAVVPVTPRERSQHPELFYHTGMFRLEAFATLARACVEAKSKHLPGTMLTYVNYSPPTGGGSWTHRGTDPFLAHRHGGLEMFWTEDWLGYSLGPQHLSDTLALGRAAGRHVQRLGAYCVGQGTPTLMRMKYYTLAAGGVRDIECYDYGPWYAGIDSWGRRFDLYRAIRDCNSELGAVDAALDGTRRRPTAIAILYNRTATIWADDNNTAPMNGSFTHWALAHAGYDADFLAEEDVEAGELARYKVLYLDGPQLRRAAAATIAAWVEQGGTLCGSAGAASRDEYDRPQETLTRIFAASSRDFQLVGNVGRPRYELRAMKPLAALTPAPDAAAAVRLDQLACQEHLEPLAGAQVILTLPDGRPAGTIHRPGRGVAIRLAAMPGVSYAHEAIQEPYDINTYLPRNFRGALRDFIAWPARLANAPRVAVAQSPIAEIVRYDGPDRAVVFVIDHRAEQDPSFRFDLTDASFTHAVAASGARVELQSLPGGMLRVKLPLTAADAIVLSRTPPRP